MVNSKCVYVSAEKEIRNYYDYRFTLNDKVTSRITEVYSEPFQTSKTKLFAKIDNGWKPLIIFANISILDVWQSFEYISA